MDDDSPGANETTPKVEASPSKSEEKPHIELDGQIPRDTHKRSRSKGRGKRRYESRGQAVGIGDVGHGDGNSAGPKTSEAGATDNM